MPRVKLSEFRAKTIINNFLKNPYSGFPIESDTDNVRVEKEVNIDKRYVVKVDQGIKKRFKQGLVKLDLSRPDKILDTISSWREKGFTSFLVEEYVGHSDDEERYLALERTNLGTLIYYSTHGGVNIEDHGDEIKKELVKDIEDIKRIALDLEIDPVILEKIVECFDINYFSFLEVNPLVVSFKKAYFLDIAAEVDSAAEFFVDTWSASDFRFASRNLTEEELNIKKLSEKSSSSLTLTVLNPNGAIFMLLSGGGISVALADEVSNLGDGKILANYGEYSGNPTEEETYIYTKNLLSLLLKSKAPKKVLVIGGGVANFTDVRITFKGVIHALTEVADELGKQNVKIYVRRGGPHQEEGLESMREFLKTNKIEGEVHGPELIVSEIVAKAIKSL